MRGRTIFRMLLALLGPVSCAPHGAAPACNFACHFAGMAPVPIAKAAQLARDVRTTLSCALQPRGLGAAHRLCAVLAVATGPIAAVSACSVADDLRGAPPRLECAEVSERLLWAVNKCQNAAAGTVRQVRGCGEDGARALTGAARRIGVTTSLGIRCSASCEGGRARLG